MANTAKYAAEGLSHYLRHLGGHHQLTREQEYELARAARKGDESARQTLATSNLAFVVAVAKKFANRGARLDDLIQEGNVGLMKAIEHFDPKKNVRFATYAVWWIRAYITRYLKDNRSQVRGGESERGSMVDFSLDATIDEEGETTFMDRLEDGGPSPSDVYLAREQDQEVHEALTKVRKRIGDLGWDILQERLTQDKPLTLEELGQRWGVSRERVRQVELKTKSFLERYLVAFNQDEENVSADAA
ncbi:RNA polymerase primary sigma factor [Stigmatella aurantiaca]|uniref:RNA polymerase sigma factor n=1 Tax=Stigmatella aurantiaca TaxID=41 RepID=A0A1H8BTJ5_STIAU|nr:MULTISPECIES: sigma-70 family RNA polymerase sigma factor [Stigmatella]SEM86185.1 RNA polymerase primary sigma factor [Stigmatella aurantiaca]